ncbi:hypothetical protein BC830DRAFT_1109473 [Chytriomyces sp. MP71]|nr:hypothetical protein BC830DRAFT_1109473 [Chytriomyces sp. MP71]
MPRTEVMSTTSRSLNHRPPPPTHPKETDPQMCNEIAAKVAAGTPAHQTSPPQPLLADLAPAAKVPPAAIPLVHNSTTLKPSAASSSRPPLPSPPCLRAIVSLRTDGQRFKSRPPARGHSHVVLRPRAILTSRGVGSYVGPLPWRARCVFIRPKGGIHARVWRAWLWTGSSFMSGAVSRLKCWRMFI